MRPISRMLLSEAADRLVKIISDEESCHLSIGERMFKLDPNVDPEAMMALVESLQYFDRMQQRTQYVAQVIDLLAAPADGHADVFSLLEDHSEKAPFADDGEWLDDVLKSADRQASRSEP